VPSGIPEHGGFVVGREGVMERRDGSYVPRVTRHGTCKETEFVVNEVGDDYFHELLWELGDWGRTVTCGGRLRGGSKEQPDDFGFGSVPKLVDEEFTRFRSLTKQDL